MSRNGSGTYSLPAGNPVVTGTTISSAWSNNTLSDIATALTQSIAYDGQTTPTANLPMGGFKHTGVAVGSALNDYARYDQLQNSSPQWLTSVAGTDTITASAPVTPSAYAAGQTFRFVSAGANTGAVTLNVSSLGAKSVTKLGTTALAAGDIPANSVVEVIYDGTQFQVVGIANQATLKTYFDTIYTTLAAVISTANTWTKAQRGAFVTLTDGATITPDFSLGNNFQCQLGGSRTLANPTNIVEGQSGVIRWIQDATGSRVLSYGWMYSAFGGTLPVLTTTAAAHDRMGYVVDHYATSTVTISIATPGVVTWTGHGCNEGDKIQFTTTGALPTGYTANTTYYVRYIDANTFSVSATRGGAAIATSGTQSGVHTAVSAEIGLTLGSNLS